MKAGNKDNISLNMNSENAMTSHFFTHFFPNPFYVLFGPTVVFFVILVMCHWVFTLSVHCDKLWVYCLQHAHLMCVVWSMYAHIFCAIISYCDTVIVSHYVNVQRKTQVCLRHILKSYYLEIYQRWWLVIPQKSYVINGLHEILLSFSSSVWSFLTAGFCCMKRKCWHNS